MTTKILVIAIFSLASTALYASQTRCDLFAGMQASTESSLKSWTSQNGVSGALFGSRVNNDDFIFVSFKPAFERKSFEISLLKSGAGNQPNTLIEFAESKIIDGHFDLTVFLRTADTLVHCYSIKE